MNNHDAFEKPAPLRWSISRVLGHGVLLAEGSEHRHQRKILEPAFAFRRVKNLYPVFWAKASEAAEAMAQMALASSAVEKTEQGIVGVDDWAVRLSLDILGAAGLGQDLGCLRNPDSPIMKAYHDVYRPSGQAIILDLLYLVLPGPLVNLLPVTRNIEYARAAKTIAGVCQDIVSDKRASLGFAPGRVDGEQASEGGGADIVSTLLRSGAFDDQQIVEQMMTFLAAGHEGPAAGLIWAMYLLCLHPQVQARLRAEVRRHLPFPSPSSQQQMADNSQAGDAAASITAADIDRLPYLAAVCSEILRFMAPTPLTIREAVKDTTIADEFVPRGTYVMLSLWATNRHAALWGPEAHRFNPDRWLTAATPTTTSPPAVEVGSLEEASILRASGSGGAESNYAFMTFTHGRKNCIGQNFAVAKLACTLANWVGRFHFSFRDPSEAAMPKINHGGSTIRPANGLHVRIKPVEG